MHPGEKNGEDVSEDAYSHADNEIVTAAWNLVEMCSMDNTNDLGAMVSDFVSRVLLLQLPLSQYNFRHHIFLVLILFAGGYW